MHPLTQILFTQPAQFHSALRSRPLGAASLREMGEVAAILSEELRGDRHLTSALGSVSEHQTLRRLQMVADGLSRLPPHRLKALALKVDRELQAKARSLSLGVNRFADPPDLAASVRSILSPEAMSNPDRIIAQAKASVPVQTGLLSWEQVAYQMAWKGLVNPDSKPISVIYGGMGPDVSTVLLATDATTIYGIDLHPFDIDRLRQALLDWARLETLKLGKERRSREGFWLVGSGTVEEALFLELKSLGVDPNTIQIWFYGDNKIKIAFDWAYPGQRPKRREVEYICYQLAWVFKDIPFPKVDVYYEKSIPKHIIPLSYLDRLPLLLAKEGGVVLIGRLDPENTSHLKRILTKADPPFKPIEVDHELTTLMEERWQRVLGSQDDYGWRLHGFRR